MTLKFVNMSAYPGTLDTFIGNQNIKQKFLNIKEHGEITHVCIGEERSDGDLGVIATFNNMDEYLPKEEFIRLVNTALFLAMSNSDNPQEIQWIERDVAVDYTPAQDS